MNVRRRRSRVFVGYGAENKSYLGFIVLKNGGILVSFIFNEMLKTFFQTIFILDLIYPALKIKNVINSLPYVLLNILLTS